MIEQIHRKIPDFFIIGAPKCGTTALSEYLREHPNIFISHPKEPHYFSTDFPGYQFITTRDEYLGLFRKVRPDHLSAGEASVFYLYSKEAALNIRDFNPNAKLVVMLRNPVDMIYSLHAQKLFGQEEDEPDFELAWELQDARRAGRHIPKYCREASHLLYEEVGKLGRQVERLLSVFPVHQIKAIIFDDFISDTRSVYEDILSFLNVPSDGREHFPPINESKVARSQWLTRFIHRPGPRMVHIKTRVREILGTDRLWLWDALKRANMKKAKRPHLRPEFQAKLIETFRPDILRLAELVGRDLSHWLEINDNGAA